MLRGATLFHLDPPRFEQADLRIEGGRIAKCAPRLEPQAGDIVDDLAGRVVMPGLVVGHHHLYSALATTMPAPPRAPRNFHQILQLVWWPLDKQLDAAAIELSARVGAFEALRCGATTIIDHHASPNCIDGSLDALAAGLDAVGVRGVLCYEVTGRNRGAAEQRQGLRENERWAAKATGPRHGAMIGAHAAFTIDDDGLDAIAALAESTGAPIHIHAAEDPCDDSVCRSRFNASLMARLEEHGILREGTVLAHGTHLSAASVKRALRAGCRFAHNTRSNMNNAVGYAPVAQFAEAGLLGTDGIGGDLFEEFRAAAFRGNEAKAGLAPGALLGMVARSAAVAGERLGVVLGKLEAGAEADLAVLAPPPHFDPSRTDPASAMLYAFASRQVRRVYSAGRIVLDDGEPVLADPAEAAAQVAAMAPTLWEGMEYPGDEDLRR